MDLTSPRQVRAMAAFHAWSGCDTTSSFFGFGKISCAKAWEKYPSATKGFLDIVNYPFKMMTTESQTFKLLQGLCCVLYDNSSTIRSVNKLRRHLFTKKLKSMDKIPPTEDSYLQHCLRVIYQVGVWMSLHTMDKIPSPEGYGWTFKDGGWQVVWGTQPPLSKATRELVSCGCKSDKGCSLSTACSCNKVNLPCTELCRCLCIEQETMEGS
eukprot:Lithocolla_globosa_v1_NODE_87_length_6640_cov_111.536826.p4 type:complete len:211 gc:universal NODE_87_length_6640_cov_111.536826:1238-606(-)